MARTEFVIKYRPKRLKDVVGQKEAVSVLSKKLKNNDLPHALLFTGESGCGKTTLARIVADRLKCGESDYYEINAAESRGIDMVRDISKTKDTKPMFGDVKVYYLDECHALTGDAQTALLKMIEDMPDWVYFILATTDPRKLKNTIITRCTQIKCPAIADDDMTALLEDVKKQEKLKHVTEDIIEKIVSVAQGSARKALVVLHQIADLEDEEEILEAVSKADAEESARNLAAALLKKAHWNEIKNILKNLEDDAEFTRQVIMNYMSSVLQNSLNKRAAGIMDTFQNPFYDTRTAKAMLVFRCYEASHFIK